MSQGKLTDGGRFCPTPHAWHKAHRDDYSQVETRLARTRRVLLHGDVRDGARVLEAAFDNAVLSIRTDLDRHERAFTALWAGDKTHKEAALMTVYGGNKKNWLRRTHEKTDWETLTLAVREHAREERWAQLLEVITDNLVGVAYRKGAFMLAMSGLTEYMCIDSNVGRLAGVDMEEDFSDAGAYMRECERVREHAPTLAAEVSPFIAQWVMYDFMRGEHARHMAFFREVIDV